MTWLIITYSFLCSDLQSRMMILGFLQLMITLGLCLIFFCIGSYGEQTHRSSKHLQPNGHGARGLRGGIVTWLRHIPQVFLHMVAIQGYFLHWVKSCLTNLHQYSLSWQDCEDPPITIIPRRNMRQIIIEVSFFILTLIDKDNANINSSYNRNLSLR